LHDIKHLQKSVALLIPRAPFARLIKEIANHFHTSLKMQSIALAAMQEASEAMIVMWFEMLYVFQHSSRLTELVTSQHFMQNALQSCRKMPA